MTGDIPERPQLSKFAGTRFKRKKNKGFITSIPQINTNVIDKEVTKKKKKSNAGRVIPIGSTMYRSKTKYYEHHSI